MDIDLDITNNGFEYQFDISLLGSDLRTESGLRSAVIISLYTDARAEPADIIPDGTNERRGCWMDSYPDIPGDQLGSRLWLLDREKEITETLRRAKTYAEESLQWLIADGIATAVEVTAERVRSTVLGLNVVITLATGGQYEDVFDYRVAA